MRLDEFISKFDGENPKTGGTEYTMKMFEQNNIVLRCRFIIFAM